MSEIEALDMAMGVSLLDGKITADDADAYLKHAIDCSNKGIGRKDWFEFFERETWKAQ